MDRRAAIKLSATLFAAGLFDGKHALAASGDGAGLQPLIDCLSRADALFDQGNYGDPSLRAAYRRHVYMVLSAAFIGVFGTSAERPDWVPYVPYFMPYLDPNPDTVYKTAPIDPRGIYRLSGWTGTETISTVTLRNGGAHLGKLTGKRVGEIDLLALEKDADKRFSVILSAKRPRKTEGQWIALPADTTTAMSRRVIKDSAQRDGVLRIERLDWPDAPLLPPDGETQQKIELAAKYASTVLTYFKAYLDGLRQRGADRELVVDDQTDYGGLVSQSYFFHHYTLAPDEALIVESNAPPSKYWSIQLFDPFAATLEFVNHQTSLNDAQAKVGDDGRVRIVISPRDPLVANWLDTGGWHQGWVIWRWNDPQSTPRPSLAKMKQSDLKKHLPRSAFVSREQRLAMLSERALFYQSRSR